MKGNAMTEVLIKLKDKGVFIEALDALEAFARNGAWQTLRYSHYVNSVTAWEIEQKFYDDLCKNLDDLKKKEIRIGDFFELSQEQQYANKFNLIVLDNWQGIYGDYCEHFESLQIAPKLMTRAGFIIFNINRRPFDIENNPEWTKRRDKFYGMNMHPDMYLDDAFLRKFYSKYFEKLGYEVRDIFFEDRNKEYLSYGVVELCKIY